MSSVKEAILIVTMIVSCENLNAICREGKSLSTFRCFNVMALLVPRSLINRQLAWFFEHVVAEPSTSLLF